MRRSAGVVVLFGLLVVGGARSGRAEVDVSGLIFFDFEAQRGADDGNENEFELRRCYINFKSDLGDDWYARATADVTRDKAKTVEVIDPATDLPVVPAEEVTVPATSGILMRLKYAYLQKKNIFEGSNLTIGLAATPWIGYVDKLFGHRFATKSLTDQTGILSSADLGLSLDGKYADGLVSYKAGIFNGEGYSKPEDDIDKVLQARVTLKPFAKGMNELLKGVQLSGFVAQPAGVGDDDDGKRIGGLAGCSVKRWALFVTVVQAEDGAPATTSEGVGVYGRFKLTDNLGLFARYYDLDPDSKAALDEETQLMAGVTLKLNDTSRMAVSYERTDYEEAGVTEDRAVRLQFEVKF